MRVEMTFDTRKLEDSLGLLARRARVSKGAVIKNEAKQIVTALGKITAPSAGSHGRKAVARDVGRVFTSLPAIIKSARAGSFEGKKQYIAALTRAARQNDENAIRELLTRPISGSETITVRPYTRNGVAVAGYTQERRFSGPPMPNITGGTQIGGTINPNLHTSRRNKYGRVTSKQLSQVVMKTKELNDYRKQVQERVGWALAGWGILAKQTGARLPAFVDKTRLEAVSGTSSVNFGERAFVRATNFNVKIPGYQRVIDTVLATRTRIAARNLERVIRGHAVNLGFTRVGGR